MIKTGTNMRIDGGGGSGGSSSGSTTSNMVKKTRKIIDLKLKYLNTKLFIMQQCFIPVSPAATASASEWGFGKWGEEILDESFEKQRRGIYDVMVIEN